MKKELEEALERLYKCNDEDYTLGYQQHDYKLLQQAILELKAIKKSNPSEALEGLKHIKKYYVPQPCSAKTYDYLEAIEQALLKAQEQSKVLEVIFEKGFDRSIKDYDNYAIWLEYKTEQFDKAIEKHPTILNWDVFDNFTYTQEEFDIIRNYFKNNS